MLLYSLPSESTSSTPAPKVLVEDLPAQVTIDPSANSADRIQAIKANGLQCLGRLYSDMTWDDWMGVLAAMKIITDEALVEVGAFKWDPDNKRAVKAFNIRWEEYEAGVGHNHKPLSKQERSALRAVANDPEILAWRSSLTGPEKRRLNHPNAVLNRFKARAKAKATPAENHKLSPHATLKAANIKLQEELHRLKQHGDGNAFTRDDSAKAIATAIIGTFDGLSTQAQKVEAIARELSAWVKAQRTTAS